MNDRIETKNVLVFLIIALIITVTIRLPFLLENINFNNDAATYSENIKYDFFSGKYNVQLPGYVSYIYMGRLIDHFIDDTTTTQHVINIMLVIMITISSFLLFKQLAFSNIEAFLFTILLSCNNILLLGSITGGNRLFLALTSIVLIQIAIITVRDEKDNLLIYYAIIFATMIGFRQDLSFYFLPLYIYLCFKVKDIKIIGISFVVFGAVCLTWFFPLINEYGGLAGYIKSTQNSHAVSDTNIIFSGFKLSPILNMLRIFVYLFNAILVLIVFFVFSIVKKEIEYPREILIILGLAFIPALIFQMLVHNGNFVQLAAFIVPIFVFLTYNFRINSKGKIAFVTILIFITLFQFFGVRMFKNPKSLPQKASNVLWLQYTFDGAKTGKTLRLKMLKDDLEKQQDNN